MAGEYMKKLQDMLPLIREATTDISAWNSLIINRRKPYTYRIWRMFGEDRVCLHRFDACDRGEAFLHPHPWPAAFLVLDGGYYQTIGRSHDLFDDPNIVAEFRMTKGSMYEITCPQAWHAIQPFENTHTVMVNGPPFTAPHNSIRTTKGKDLLSMDEANMVVSLKLFNQLISKELGDELPSINQTIGELIDELEPAAHRQI
jgi:hypothetical protein